MKKKFDEDALKMKFIWGENLVTNLPPWSPELDVQWGHRSQRFGQVGENAKRADSQNLRLLSASSLPSASRKWVFDHWIPEAELTVIAGPVCAGKTTFLCALAAAVSRGKGIEVGPGLKTNGCGFILYLTTENDIERSVRPHLEAMDANMDVIRFFDVGPPTGNESRFSFANELHVKRLVHRAKTEFHDNVGLVVIDPIYFSVDGDLSNNTLARKTFEGLTGLSKSLNCAIVGAAHTGKNCRGKPPLDRVAGPPALRQVPRSTIVLEKIENGPTETGGTHVIVHARNEGRMDGGFEYRNALVEIAGPNGPITTTIFEITKELQGSAEAILASADSITPIAGVKKKDAAIALLETALKDGPKTKCELLELAKVAKISEATLVIAKGHMNIESAKRKGDGLSVWSLSKS